MEEWKEGRGGDTVSEGTVGHGWKGHHPDLRGPGGQGRVCGPFNEPREPLGVALVRVLLLSCGEARGAAAGLTLAFSPARPVTT